MRAASGVAEDDDLGARPGVSGRLRPSKLLARRVGLGCREPRPLAPTKLTARPRREKPVAARPFFWKSSDEGNCWPPTTGLPWVGDMTGDDGEPGEPGERGESLFRLEEAGEPSNSPRVPKTIGWLVGGGSGGTSTNSRELERRKRLETVRRRRLAGFRVE